MGHLLHSNLYLISIGKDVRLVFVNYIFPKTWKYMLDNHWDYAHHKCLSPLNLKDFRGAKITFLNQRSKRLFFPPLFVSNQNTFLFGFCTSIFWLSILTFLENYNYTYLCIISLLKIKKWFSYKKDSIKFVYATLPLCMFIGSSQGCRTCVGTVGSWPPSLVSWCSKGNKNQMIISHKYHSINCLPTNIWFAFYTTVRSLWDG